MSDSIDNNEITDSPKNEPDFRALFSQALGKIEQLNEKLADKDHSVQEPIAIIGMGCRYPGANTPEQFWDLLCDKVDAVVPIAGKRWSTDAEINSPGTRWAGLIDDVESFDAAFFGISNREAELLDPQQRLLLEVSWQALEDAGIPADKLVGSKTGVFVGLCSNDYYECLQESEDAFATTGGMQSIAAGRISYAFGFEGPSIMLDTACSSSLVGVHLACQSLRNGESDLALAGGVNLILSPNSMNNLARTQAVSPDGRCKTFDASANGFVRAEGCGIITLKRLSDAQKDGDRILAQITGSAVNQDGRSTGLTAPNVLAQSNVIRQALVSAKLNPKDITYVETHGTGTPLGDPIEVEALRQVFGGLEHEFVLGAAKSNLGHLEAAAGVVGLMKATLALVHKKIPPNLHFNSLNPRIDLRDTTFVMPTEIHPWPASDQGRHAGISAFGMSGTNAHVILQEACQPTSEPKTSISTHSTDESQIIPMSAFDESALSSVIENFLTATGELSEDKFADFCHAARVGRSHLAARTAVLACSAEVLRSRLIDLHEHRSAADIRAGNLDPRRIVFVFSGQGSQYAQMGRHYWERQPVFKEALQRCADILDGQLERPLLEILFPAEGVPTELEDTKFAQPALFAFEYALSMLWFSWGIRPEVVIGHSVGEYVAAHIAGVFSLEDALRLMVVRGSLMQKSDEGAMISVPLDESTLQAEINGFDERLSIAAINDPQHCVVSGPKALINQFCEQLSEREIRIKTLRVRQGFHSSLMEPILDEFEEAIKSVTFEYPEITLLSNLSGNIADEELTRPDYWRRHLRSPVRFWDGLEKILASDEPTAFIEIGPAPVLTTIGVSYANSQNNLWLCSARPNHNEDETIRESLASLYSFGVDVDWVRYDAAYTPGRRVKLPGYPFQRRRFTALQSARVSDTGLLNCPILETKQQLSQDEFEFTFTPRLGRHPYIWDHTAFGQVVVPGAFYISMVAAGIKELTGSQACAIRNFRLLELMTIGAEGAKIYLHIEHASNGRFSCSITGSRGEHSQERVKLVSAQVEIQMGLEDSETGCDYLLPQDEVKSNACALYRKLEKQGIEFGSSLHCVRALKYTDEGAVASLALDEKDGVESSFIHPGLLDSCFQVLLAATSEDGAVHVPVELDEIVIGNFVVNRDSDKNKYRVSAQGVGSKQDLIGTVDLYDSEGSCLVQFRGARMRRLSDGVLSRLQDQASREQCFEIQWRLQKLNVTKSSSNSNQLPWVIFGKDSESAKEIATRLKLKGLSVVRLLPSELNQLNELPPLAGVISCMNDSSELESFGTSLQAPLEWHRQLVGLRLQSELKNSRMIWLFSGAHAFPHRLVSIVQASLWGLGRTIQNEHPELYLKLIDSSEHPEPPEFDELLQEILDSNHEPAVLYDGAARHVARITQVNTDGRTICLSVDASPKDDVSYSLKRKPEGGITDLIWGKNELTSPQEGEVELEVLCAGLNFKDVLCGLGVVPGGEHGLGNECVGRVTRCGENVKGMSAGDIVFGLAPRSLSQKVIVDYRYLALKPSYLLNCEAATIPAAFVTAWVALHSCAQLKKGESILVHAAAGGVGMAVIQLAHNIGATVFATAHPRKWPVLKALGVKRLMSSRTLDFETEVKELNEGRGVDVAINCLAGDFISATVNTLATGGRFIELGRVSKEETACMLQQRPDISYDLVDLSTRCADLIQADLAMLAEQLEQRKIRPIPYKVHDISNYSEVFSLMAKGRHVGKLVFSMVPEIEHISSQINDASRYMVTGAFGGIGRDVCRWLVSVGAKHLVLVSRSDVDASGQEFIHELSASGVDILVRKTDLGEQSDVQKLAAELNQEALPLRGIFHFAGVVSDGPIHTGNLQWFDSVLRGKADGAWHLHRAFIANSLDFFVLSSSVAALLGAVGQGNYAAANAYLDGLAHYRRSLGLRGTSIALGPWGGAGMYARMSEEDQERIGRLGFRPLAPTDAIRMFMNAINGVAPHQALMNGDWRKLSLHHPSTAAVFSEFLLEEQVEEDAAFTEQSAQVEVSTDIMAMAAKDRRPAIRQAICEITARCLRLATPEEAARRSLSELGVDSLLAVEIRNAIAKRFDKALPVSLIFDHPTVDRITDFLLSFFEDSPIEPTFRELNVTNDEEDNRIAIVGVGCRFPGGATDAESYWNLLNAGEDAITEVPKSRFDVEALFDPRPNSPGRINTKWGGFLDDIELFDAEFFGISPREARSMDPQQRLLLEVTWDALEHAYIAPQSMMNSRTGVFVGMSSNEYRQRAGRPDIDDGLDPWYGTGNAGSVASGRISYLLGLQGPSLVIDTACSSSLVATHLACKSLLDGECDVALTGGVNLILTPELTLYFSRLGGMASDGRCKTFDSSADGYVRSEGCGMVVLKRLRDAEANGDRILAVIAGSAVNQDGRSHGLTAPNGPAQESVILSALRSARVSPEDVTYVEAHGTGTELGDPIELEALHNIYGSSREEEILVGSVKTNIGHTEAAAGVASLIKLALAMHHKVIPGNLHCQQPTTKFDWENSALRVPTQSGEWLLGRQSNHRAGLSSFGFSGTNAHLIIEGVENERTLAPLDRNLHFLVFSGHTEEALHSQSIDMATRLEDISDEDLRQLCANAARLRTDNTYRIGIVGDSASNLCKQLRDYQQGSMFKSVGHGVTDETELAFLFSGQGSQYSLMCKQLYESEPIFRSLLDRCADTASQYMDRPLLEFITDEDVLHSTAVAQPALFAIQYSLAQFWIDLGVQPRWLLGHSIGEYAAACVAGIFSLEDGIRLTVARGRLMEQTAEGTMLSVQCSEERIREFLSFELGLSLAAVNGPESVVVSGAPEAIEAFNDTLQDNGLYTRLLKVNRAFHSGLMDPILNDFERVASSVEYHPANIPMLSTITGTWSTGETSTAEYWRNQIRDTVCYWAGLSTLLAEKNAAFLEIGPSSTLSSIGAGIHGHQERLWIPSLRRNESDPRSIAQAAAHLFVLGVPVDVEHFAGGEALGGVLPPAYPYQRKRYWIEQETGQILASGSAQTLLGKKLPAIASSELTVFDASWSLDHFGYLRDHSILGTCVVPAAVHLAVMSAAGQKVIGPEIELKDVVFTNMVSLGEGEQLQVQVHVAWVHGGTEVSLHVLKDSAWVKCACGSIEVMKQKIASEELESTKVACHEPVSVDALYKELVEFGISYGPKFRCLSRVFRGEGQLWAELKCPADSAFVEIIHPILIDGALQASGALAQSLGTEPHVPFAIEQVWLARSSGETDTLIASAHLRSDKSPDAVSAVCDVEIFDLSGEVVARMSGVQFRQMNSSPAAREKREIDRWLYELSWLPNANESSDQTSMAESLPSKLLVFSDKQGLGSALVAQLAEFSEVDILEVLSTASSNGNLGQRLAVDGANAEAVDVLVSNWLSTANENDRLGVVYLWGLDQDPRDLSVTAWQHGLQGAMHLSRALVNHGVSCRLLLVSEGAMSVVDSDQPSIWQSPLWGFGRSLQVESPQLACQLVDIEAAASDQHCETLISILSRSDDEDQIAYRDNCRHVARLARSGSGRSLIVPEEPWYDLVFGERGSLESLEFRAVDPQVVGAGEILVEIEASGLNFRDVLNVLGMYNGEAGPLGGEFSGVVLEVGAGVTHVSKGDLVMGLSSSTFGRCLVTDARLVVRVPSNLNAIEAATIPIAFLTAWYSLHELGNLDSEDSVLIHAAAGGVGMAAVQLCQRVGAEVWATASPSKWGTLKQLGVEHIMNSRTLDFADEIREKRQGAGLSIVLNALSGEFIHQSLSLLGDGGHFLEMGKSEFLSDQEMTSKYPEVMYSPFDLATVDPDIIQSMLKKIANCLVENELKPLPQQLFPYSESISAFQYMARARHVGKVVLSRDAESQYSDHLIRGDGIYLVTGGLGALGQYVAHWLIDAGAKNIVLVSRSNPSEDVQEQLNQWREQDISVSVVAADVSSSDSVKALFAKISTYSRPLKGVFHTAGIIDDGMLGEQTWERFTNVAAAKLDGSWHLHQASLDLSLDHFVLFSSAASLLGSPGQSNYSAANAFLDTLAMHRRSLGLPGLSVNWGPWSSGGMASRAQAAGHLELEDDQMIAPAKGIALLARLMSEGRRSACVLPMNVRNFANTMGSGSRPLYQLLQVESTSQAQASDLLNTLESMDESERKQHLGLEVRKMAAMVLGFESPEAIDTTRPLHDQGLDSLMAVELRNKLSKAFGQDMPASIVFDYPTVEKLSVFMMTEFLHQTEASSDVIQSVLDNPGFLDEEMSDEDLLNTMEELLS